MRRLSGQPLASWSTAGPVSLPVSDSGTPAPGSSHKVVNKFPGRPSILHSVGLNSHNTGVLCKRRPHLKGYVIIRSEEASQAESVMKLTQARKG